MYNPRIGKPRVYRIQCLTWCCFYPATGTQYYFQTWRHAITFAVEPFRFKECI